MQQCDRTTIRVTLTLPVRHTVFFPTSCTEEYNGVTFKKVGTNTQAWTAVLYCLCETHVPRSSGCSTLG